jgi:hypothetical protein
LRADFCGRFQVRKGERECASVDAAGESERNTARVATVCAEPGFFYWEVLCMTKASQSLPTVILDIENVMVCPHCGARGLDNFRHLEDIQACRDLISLNQFSPGTVLEVEGAYELFDENGQNPRLLCNQCDCEAAIPDGFEVDFV